MLKNCLNNLIQLDDLKKEVASYGDTLWSTQDILNMINDIPVAVCNCNTKEECYKTIFDLFGIVINYNSSSPDTDIIDEEDIKRLEKYEDYLWSLGIDATEEEKKDLQSFKKVITALKLVCLEKEKKNEIS